MKTKLFIISIALFLLTAVYANSQQKNTNKSDSASGYITKHPNYIDKNKDGVCDKRPNTNATSCCGRGNGCGKGQGNGCMHRHGWKNGKCNNNMQKK